MKILHINSYYLMGNFYKNLYDRQIENGIDISVYVPVNKSAKIAKDHGNYTCISKVFSSLDRVFYYVKHNKILLDIQKKYKIEEFNILHAHSLFSNGYIAYRLNEIYNIPYIVAVRNTDINVFFKKMPHLRPLGIKIIKKAKRVVFISEAYRKHLVEKYINENYRKSLLEKSIVIPNGIDKFWFDNIGMPHNEILEKEINILCVGDISRNKNQISTVKACELLIKNGYKIRYNLVGKIIDKRLFKHIEKKPFIRYLGFREKEELLEIYKENDIFIMPSITETFGLVYAEALSQGLPVIYSEGQGFDGQFAEGIVGYHVKAKEYLQIVDTIDKILSAYNDISSNCITHVKKFDWNKINERYYEIYKNM